MTHRQSLGLLLLPWLLAAADARPVMPVGTILEQRYRDDDLAVVISDRLQLFARSSKTSPWHFCFPGFETTWTHGPLEIEITGSGNYATQDVFSIAALSLDYHTPDGWAERSLFGLGLIQNQRGSHPPSWGVGGDGTRTVLRGNLLSARPEPQRITIDPAKHAPKGWDGRLWIGLLLHNTGTDRTLSVRIVNALPPSGQPAPTAEPDEKAKWSLVARHQTEFLRFALNDLEAVHVPDVPLDRVPADLRPYAKGLLTESPGQAEAARIRRSLEDTAHPPGAEAFVSLSSSYFSATKAVPRNEEVLDRVRRFHDTWESTGRLGHPLRVIVRAATGAEKVGLADLSAGRILPNPSDPVRLSAARHEYESFQLVVTPLPGSTDLIVASPSDLKSNGGHVIPAGNVTVNPVGYVRATPDHLVPDPLLADTVAPPLVPGENQPFWITLYVPPDAVPGSYTGTVRLSNPKYKGPIVDVPLEVTVRPFNIPRQISLRSSFWMFRDQLNRFYHLDEIPLDDYFQWIDMALRHRLNPIDVYEGHCRQLLPLIVDEKTGQPVAKSLTGVPNPNPDFAAWDRYLDRMIAGGANTLHLGQSHHQGAFFEDKGPSKLGSATQMSRLVQSTATLRDHYAKRGLLKYHYLQLRDETSAPESLAAYRETQKAFPDLKLLLTAPAGDARPFLGIPCPLTPAFDSKWRDEVKAKGGEYWWYVCVEPRDPRYANLFLTQTAAQHRALFWQTWANDVDGLLYWGLNFWSWYDHKYPADAKGPTTRVPPRGSFNFCPLPDAPGDGFSMYPGPTPSQPLSSVRLEVMRDGEEDYEYLVLLDRLIGQKEKSHPSSPAVASAKAARDAARKLVASLTDYPREGAPYLQIRDQVAEAIEGLMGLK